jgi:hypothetical protein
MTEFGGQPAFAHDQDPVADVEHLGQLRGDHQDGHPVPGQPGQQPVNFGLGGDVDAAGGLVHDEQRRAAAQPLGQHHLLLVAAGQPGHRVDQAAVLQVEPDGPVGGERALGCGPDQPALAQPAERGQRHVLLHRHVHDQALLAPVLGNEADPGGHGRGRRGAAQLAAAHHHLARVVPVDAEHGPGHFAAARADQPGQGDDLARPHLQRDVGEHPFPGQVLDQQHPLAGGAALPGGALLHLPADHRADQVVGGQPGQLAGQHVPAVPHYGDLLADLEDLFQPVRDEQHRGARGAQRAHHLEQPGHLGRGQRRGRLVHHDHPGVQRQRLGDLHDLLVGDGQPAADPARVEPHAEPGKQFCGLRVHPAPVDAPPGHQRLAAHEDVLGHGQVGEQRWFLVDDRDPGPGGGRAVQGDRLPVDQQRPAVRLVHPARIFTTVDLPAPFSPTSAWASPADSSIEPSTTARTAPNDLAACSRASTGAAGSVSAESAAGAVPPGSRPAGAGPSGSRPAGAPPPPAVTARSPFLGGLSG